jgi:hypothetical protein
MTQGVLPRERPPIRKTIVVRSDVTHAFETFTGQLAAGWPLVPFSRGGERVTQVRVDPYTGGVITEVWDDGTTRVWGDVLTWDPPASFAMTWNVTGTPTEVELDFAALGPALTRIQLEHRGWERLSGAELEEDCAIPADTSAAPSMRAGTRS